MQSITSPTIGGVAQQFSNAAIHGGTQGIASATGGAFMNRWGGYIIVIIVIIIILIVFEPISFTRPATVADISTLTNVEAGKWWRTKGGVEESVKISPEFILFIDGGKYSMESPRINRLSWWVKRLVGPELTFEIEQDNKLVEVVISWSKNSIQLKFANEDSPREYYNDIRRARANESS
jgi:hypothetical protein